MVTTRTPQEKFGVVSATTVMGESVINRKGEKLGWRNPQVLRLPTVLGRVKAVLVLVDSDDVNWKPIDKEKSHG